MKKMACLLVVTTVLTWSQAFGGSGCCGMSMKAPKQESEKTVGDAQGLSGCKGMLETLNLSDEQKAKVADIMAACPKEGCTDEQMEKCLSALGDVLTPEQLEQFKSKCRKACGDVKEPQP